MTTCHPSCQPYQPGREYACHVRRVRATLEMETSVAELRRNGKWEYHTQQLYRYRYRYRVLILPQKSCLGLATLDTTSIWWDQSSGLIWLYVTSQAGYAHLVQETWRKRLSVSRVTLFTYVTSNCLHVVTYLLTYSTYLPTYLSTHFTPSTTCAVVACLRYIMYLHVYLCRLVLTLNRYL
ncbi:hypothetical protein F4859DRAFT_464815 [Xylaria cf. heliscus]|nr:hypothetical protein F4859DRAFT_464815 [Xylaria cf. heliscus]